jgi:CcmD family protein
MLRRAIGSVVAFLLVTGSAFAQPPQQNEFVPVDKLPPGDQLPSAPLLIAAYVFVWIATLFYLWTIWRRLGNVEADMRGLEQRRASGTRR